MVMDGILDEEEGEDKDHKVPTQSMEAEVEFQNEAHGMMGAGVDNPHKLKEKLRGLMVHEAVEDSIDEIGVHEGDNSPLVIALAELPAIEFEMARSQSQRFAPEKNQELT